jgi:hypothetical protein
MYIFLFVEKHAAMHTRVKTGPSSPQRVKQPPSRSGSTTPTRRKKAAAAGRLEGQSQSPPPRSRRSSADLCQLSPQERITAAWERNKLFIQRIEANPLEQGIEQEFHNNFDVNDQKYIARIGSLIGQRCRGCLVWSIRSL